MGEDVFFWFESGFSFSWICDPRQVSAAESSCFSELSVRNSFSKKIENRLNILLLCCVVFFFFWCLPRYLDFAQVQSHFVGKKFFCLFCCCCFLLFFFVRSRKLLFRTCRCCCLLLHVFQQLVNLEPD